MDGVNGLLYKYDSEQDLANAINKLVENPDLLLEMQARTNVPLGFTGFMDHIETIYDSLIAGERPPADNFNLVYKELLK
jgi:glycosyltransferase involved in cell wall biosynthesis